jgi:hypothetical protein
MPKKYKKLSICVMCHWYPLKGCHTNHFVIFWFNENIVVLTFVPWYVPLIQVSIVCIGGGIKYTVTRQLKKGHLRS